MSRGLGFGCLRVTRGRGILGWLHWLELIEGQAWRASPGLYQQPIREAGHSTSGNCFACLVLPACSAAADPLFFSDEDQHVSRCCM